MMVKFFGFLFGSALSATVLVWLLHGPAGESRTTSLAPYSQPGTADESHAVSTGIVPVPAGATARVGEGVSTEQEARTLTSGATELFGSRQGDDSSGPGDRYPIHATARAATASPGVAPVDVSESSILLAENGTASPDSAPPEHQPAAADSKFTLSGMDGERAVGSTDQPPQSVADTSAMSTLSPPHPSSPPDSPPPEAPHPAGDSFGTGEAVDGNGNDGPRWRAIWQPFFSHLSASGFAARLANMTGLDYRVADLERGQYQVQVAYQDDEQLRERIARIEALTGPWDTAVQP